MNYSWKTSCPAKNGIYDSKTFTAQGNEWKMLITNRNDKIYLSLEYLGSSYFDIFTEYCIIVNDKRKVKGLFQFSQVAKDFGFYVDKSEQYAVELYLLVNSGHYDSRAVTGYVGLRNLGATCYINSFIQTVFNIKKFRFDILNCEPVEKMLVLQKLFYKMQTEEEPIDTTDFVLSNVWDDNIYLHQDIHEFSKVFFDTIEKESKKKEIIEDLIQGRVTNYIKASCGCTRKIKENFQDIQVEIRDFFNHKLASNLEDSFKKYTKPEILNESNKYKCDEHGLVDAEKGVLFSDLPPVLFILLKRFNMDYETGEGYKINDYFEFPDVLDMEPYCDEEEESLKRQTVYKLYSIVVHKGGHDEGHFYVYICINEQWFKFNDTVVSSVSKEEAMFMNFGGKHPYKKKVKDYSAYYLVYLNKEKIPDLLYTDINIPDSVLQAIMKKEDKKPVKVFGQEDIRGYNGPGFHNLHTFDYSLTNYQEVDLVPGDDIRVLRNKVESLLNTKSRIYLFEVVKKKDNETGECDNGDLNAFEISFAPKGIVNLNSHYFIYKSYNEIDFTYFKLIFIKTFRDDVWCKDTVPTNLSLCFSTHFYGSIGENYTALKDKTGFYNPVVYLETGLVRLDNDFLLQTLKNGDVLVVAEENKDTQIQDFMNELAKRMCINVLNGENNFCMFIPRNMSYTMVEKAIRDYVSDDSVIVVDNLEEDDTFKTANEDSLINRPARDISNCVLDKNSLEIELGKGKKIIYLGQSFSHIDYNTIKHVHPFVVPENIAVDEMVKKVLVSPFQCFSGAQKHSLQDVRIIDTIKGVLYLKSFKLTDKFTSRGMNVIQIFSDERFIKGAYYTGHFNVIGYPFYIFTDCDTVYEFRAKFRIYQRLVRFDGNEYVELDSEDKLTIFCNETFLLIEMK